MKKVAIIILALILSSGLFAASLNCNGVFPKVTEIPVDGYFPLSTGSGVATICIDRNDHAVVGIAAQMLADDIERVTGAHAANPACI